MKRIRYLSFLLFCVCLIFSCSPLMHDLEQIDSNNDQPESSVKEIKSVEIIGTPAKGVTIFAIPTDEKGNAVAGTIFYKWQYYDESEKNWKNIEGETKSSFVCKTDFVGKKIRALANVEGKAPVASDEPIVLDKLPEDTLILESVEIIGNAIEDGTVFVVCKDPDGYDVSKDLIYQWQYFDETTGEWKNIDSADKAFFECSEEYAEKKIRVNVTQKDKSVTSVEKVVEKKPEPAPEKLIIQTVTIVGNAKECETVFAEVKDKDGKTVTEDVTFQWQYYDETAAEWKPISGATKQFYECSEEYAEKKIRVNVTQDDKNVTSEEKVVEKKPEPAPEKLIIQTVTIVGNAKECETVFAEVKDKDGKTVTEDVTFQWQYYDETAAEWKPIGGATKQFYECSEEYAEKKIRVTVTQDDKNLTSEEKIIVPITDNNDVAIASLKLFGEIACGEKIYVTPLDADNKVVDGNITYKWEYYDSINDKWITLTEEVNASFTIPDDLYNKQVRVTATKDGDSKYALCIPKGKKYSELNVEFLPILVGEEFSKDNVVITAKDVDGNPVEIHDYDFDLPSWFPAVYDESDLVDVVIHVKGFESVTVTKRMEIYERPPKLSRVPRIVESRSGWCKFESWGNDQYLMEWSENGYQWHTDTSEFKKVYGKVYIRTQGDYNESGDYWWWRPSESIIVYIDSNMKGSSKVTAFDIVQEDINISFDDTTGTITATENFNIYLWYVKTGNSEPFKIESGNTFNLADFMSTQSSQSDFQQYVENNPQFGLPGKYYIMVIASNASTHREIDDQVSYSSSCWVTLE